MYTEVIQFWFEEIDKSMWWKKDPAFDEQIKQRFGSLHEQAIQGELFQWRESAPGRLAEIILLDQFSRNIYRDSPKAFAYDPMATVLAQEAISCEDDLKLTESERSFVYMPLMHSESRVIHALAEKVFSQLGNPNSLEFERQHKAIIDRFGRYPHRNKILGRTSSEEEIAFLQTPGSSF